MQPKKPSFFSRLKAVFLEDVERIAAFFRPRARDLESEIELLTTYSTDTIYRLRYDTMTYDYISPSISRLLGYTSKEINALNFRSLILETRIVAEGMKSIDSYEGLEGTRKRGEVDKWQADYRMKTKDGEEVWISDISYPWFDAKGAIIGSVGSLRDITERVVAESQVKEELVRLATTDSLTALANRRSFFSRLEEELKRVRRHMGDVSLLVVDIDHFKKINDAYGHSAGDQMLRDVANIITAALRETDLPARIGGEEFGVILPETQSEGAFWVAERIRAAVARHLASYTDHEGHTHDFGCTVSIGVAAAAYDHQETAESLYKAADTRLYIAKNTGRNQVAAAEEAAQLH